MRMPRRDDVHKVLIIGSGPIIIWQACEFDYSGTQTCKALRKLGYKIVLVNSNPATIMTRSCQRDLHRAPQCEYRHSSGAASAIPPSPSLASFASRLSTVLMAHAIAGDEERLVVLLRLGSGERRTGELESADIGGT